MSCCGQEKDVQPVAVGRNAAVVPLGRLWGYADQRHLAATWLCLACLRCVVPVES